MPRKGAGPGPDRGPTDGMPRWVKILLAITVALVLLFVVAQLTGLGGGHGPGRHLPAGR